LAFITNNSFLDGIIHRQMRKSLLESFDKIYIIDLHGNSRKKETAPDGSVDQNVFDIMAGVSINIFVKTGNNKNKELMITSKQGSREEKCNYLINNNINSTSFDFHIPSQPDYNFKKIGSNQKDIYNKGFQVNILFLNNNSGLATEFDDMAINIDRDRIVEIKNDLHILNVNEIASKYSLKDKYNKKIENAINDIVYNTPLVLKINYRPFDYRYTIYTGKSNGLMGRPRNSTMKHFIEKENVGIIVSRTVYGNYNWQDIQVTKMITEKGIMAMRVGNAAIICPLYLYPDSNQAELAGTPARTPNLDMGIVQQFAAALGLTFTNEKEASTSSASPSTFAPIDLLDYIYAVLHSPLYRETYKAFLKIDFPRVPLPKSAEQFWALVAIGGQIRALHLLESPAVQEYIASYPVSGSNEVDKPVYKEGKVYINTEQYFDGVPLLAWEFYIGGYQPAQKWLKDRKGRTLTTEDIRHYSSIIVALTETHRLMQAVDEVGVV
jgi:predicted helicase